METTREIALRTYTDATKYGMQDTPMNWHIWKRAFDIAESELKKLRVTDVSVSVCDCTHTQACNICGSEKGLDGDFWDKIAK